MTDYRRGARMTRVVFEEPMVEASTMGVLVKQRVLVDGSPTTFGVRIAAPCTLAQFQEQAGGILGLEPSLRHRGKYRDEALAKLLKEYGLVPVRELREALEADDPSCGRCGGKDAREVCPGSDRIPSPCTNWLGC